MTTVKGKTPEQMAKEYGDYFMPGEDNRAYTSLIKEIAFLAGYKAATDDRRACEASDDFPPKWTPVTEALPEEDKRVFVFFNGRITVAQLQRRDEPWCEAGYFRVWTAHPVNKNDNFECYEWKKVTHWMPIPEMPLLSEALERPEPSEAPIASSRL